MIVEDWIEAYGTVDGGFNGRHAIEECWIEAYGLFAKACQPGDPFVSRAEFVRRLTAIGRVPELWPAVDEDGHYMAVLIAPPGASQLTPGRAWQ